MCQFFVPRLLENASPAFVPGMFSVFLEAKLSRSALWTGIGILYALFLRTGYLFATYSYGHDAMLG